MMEARGLLKPFSLSGKIVLLTILASCAVWIVLDRIQTESLRDIFEQQLAERLAQEALEDRLDFDGYISAHNQLVRMLVSQKVFIDYVESEPWQGHGKVQATYHEKPPPWLTRLSSFRSFTRPRHALLLDDEGMVREVYLGGGDRMPESLLEPGGYLREQSRGQNFLTSVDGIPYLITSETAPDSERRELATLMLASPLDDEFLIDSQGIYRGRLVAIVMGDSPRIVTSSNLDLIPSGASLVSLEGRYVVTGQEFYEYGDSELAFSFASFISTEEIEALTNKIVSQERRQRSVLAFGAILFFSAIIVLVTRRSERFAHRMIDLSEKAFSNGVADETGDIDPGACGKTLEERVREQATRLERAGQLKSFLSPQIAEMILSDQEGSSLKPHRREVVVVFLDLRGFTSFAETSEPEEVMAVLREFQEEMGRLIVSHEGTLEHFAGDGMMIVFNDPTELPNPAESAVRMAVAMRERVVDLRSGWQSRGYSLDCGFGIAQGFATIGAIGFEGRWDYSAIGTVVNIASRFCDEAKGCQILITHKTLGSVESLVEVETLEPLQLKGISKPLPAYNVLRLTS
jgi:class 3 adenylate cyclase